MFGIENVMNAILKKLEYPDGTVHDVIITSSFYNKDADAYYITYNDLTDKKNRYTFLTKYNNEYMKDVDYERIVRVDKFLKKSKMTNPNSHQIFIKCVQY